MVYIDEVMADEVLDSRGNPTVRATVILSDGTKEMGLRPKEVEILDYFIAHPHRLISQEELVQNIWEFDTLPSDATLRSYIRKLREVIGAKKIVTQRGLGYRYE